MTFHDVAGCAAVFQFMLGSRPCHLPCPQSAGVKATVLPGSPGLNPTPTLGVPHLLPLLEGEPGSVKGPALLAKDPKAPSGGDPGTRACHFTEPPATWGVGGSRGPAGLRAFTRTVPSA